MIEAIIAFLAGLLIGSFLNVCIHRLPRDLSIVQPRSFCPNCKRTIAWYDNIPLLSYALLRGRCRYCGQRIAIGYPVVELTTAVCFAICVGTLGPTLPALKWCVFSALLIALTATDFEQRILPNELTIGGTAAGLAFALVVPLYPGAEPLASFEASLLGAAVAGGSIWFVGWAYKKVRRREGMGFGDVKMIAMMGAFLGARDALLTMAAGSALGAIAGIAFIKIAGKDPSTYELPFGSFLGIAGLLVTVFIEVLGWPALG
ncbi:MAG: prepilin peptidase [Bryobacterales bacterium]|nr:prepilin peptidase [Bryobacterales bacterium]MBV9398008.1 prepilin peptidase [Bryobacterales bacterium]